jgi:Spy/CpxP family protein refolding chaperone
MKAISKAMLATALMAGAMTAQPQFGPPDPATMVQRRVERLTQVLSLTSSQAAQATTIFTNAETSITPIQTNIQTYRTNLQTAVKGNQLATIDQLAGQIGAAEGQILSIQSKADAAFYAILTADQQTKVNSMPGMLGGGRGFGPGGPMGRMRGGR